MVKIRKLSRYEKHHSETDFATAIDLETIRIHERVTEFLAEGVPCRFIVRNETITYSYYEENYETGGYGPGMQQDPELSKVREDVYFHVGDEEDYAHYFGMQKTISRDNRFYQIIEALVEGDHEIVIPMQFYRIISNYRWDLFLNKLFDQCDKSYKKASHRLGCNV